MLAVLDTRLRAVIAEPRELARRGAGGLAAPAGYAPHHSSVQRNAVRLLVCVHVRAHWAH